jgi:hypothetical protein
MEHFFPKRGVYGFAREQDDARIVTLVNAASETRDVPWSNVAPWVHDAVAVSQLQSDGTLAPSTLTEGATLEPWQHLVLVIQK